MLVYPRSQNQDVVHPKLAQEQVVGKHGILSFLHRGRFAVG
jgi:hypothetical protein